MELLREFQIEKGLSDEELVAVVCEAILLTDRRSAPVLRRLEVCPKTPKEERAWQEEAARRALARELKKRYAERYGASESARKLRKDALELAQQVVKYIQIFTAKQLLSGCVLSYPGLYTFDAIRILRKLGKPSKLGERLAEFEDVKIGLARD